MGPEKPERGWVKYAALAASVLLMAGGVALWPGLGLRERFASLFEQDVPPLYATQIGERSAISLADGSVMTLNTDSQVRVNYSSGERSVIMLKGQALFDVVKDATRPFVVKAGGREITVLGTSFDVRVKGTGALTVTLVDGKVAIAEPDVDALELNPGEQYIASEARAPQVRLANVERITSWQSGRLIFDGEPLGDAIEEINRYSVKKLIVKDERLNQLQVSGVFKTGASDRFVAAVSAYFPVDAVEESGNITLIWRDKNGQ